MFRLDMQSIRQQADVWRLMANPANLAKAPCAGVETTPEISQQGPELAGLAKLAISHGSPELLTARLIAAAMRACDAHGDGPEARAQMRDEVLATPSDQIADLFCHFTECYQSVGEVAP